MAEPTRDAGAMPGGVEEPLVLLCVHAHPDDEVTSTGGVLARYAEEGVRSVVVTATGGERGEIVGPGMDPDEVRPRLAEVRRAELATALELLGAEGLRFLGYRDSGMVGTEGNDDPGSFWRAPLDEAVGRLVGHVRELRPSVYVTYDPFGGYGHPDHVQAHRVGVLAAEAAGDPRLYPEAGPAWRIPKVYQQVLPRSMLAGLADAFAAAGVAPPSDDGQDLDAMAALMGVDDELVTTTVDVRPWLDRKWAALRAHVSQIAPDSFFLQVPESLRADVFGTEHFVRTRSLVACDDVEDDLFSGLR